MSTVEIQTALQVSQPGPLLEGKTEVVPEVTVKAKDKPRPIVGAEAGGNCRGTGRALTAVGSSTRDIIAILQNLKSGGCFGCGTGGDLMNVALNEITALAGSNPAPLTDKATDKESQKQLSAAQDFAEHL